MINQSDLAVLNQRKQELEQQIEALMKDIRPLKKELEQVTKAIYLIHCEQARELPVWELRISTAKTLQENGWDQENIVVCSSVTWQQMYDTAVQYFAENGITGWTMNEDADYRDFGQFCYEDGYTGGPVLGVFYIIEPLPNIARAFDYEGIS